MGKMMLSDYNKKYNLLDGVGYEYKFDNGYGASVVCHMMRLMVVIKDYTNLLSLTPRVTFVTVHTI